MIVTGLRRIKGYGDASTYIRWPLAWDKNGLFRQHCPTYTRIYFDEDIGSALDDDLSPVSFQRLATELLDFVVNARRPGCVSSTYLAMSGIAYMVADISS